MLGREPKGVDCPAIDGIIAEAENVAGEVDDKSVLDAALIAAAQAVEHYEMTRHGTLIAWAKKVGRKDCCATLSTDPRRRERNGQKVNSDGRESSEPQGCLKSPQHARSCTLLREHAKLRRWGAAVFASAARSGFVIRLRQTPRRKAQLKAGLFLAHGRNFLVSCLASGTHVVASLS
jgi:Domain of unknown function (DUF892)